LPTVALMDELALGSWLDVIDKVETLQGRATGEFLDGDYDPPKPVCAAGRAIRSAAKIAAWQLVNAESPVPERRLFALVDAVACLLAHGGCDGGRYVREETARLALETTVGSAAALAAVHTLVEVDRWM